MKRRVKLERGDVVTVSDGDAERVADLIERFNERCRSEADGEDFVVCIRVDGDWSRVNGGPTEAFQCAILAASVAAADGVTAAVFSLHESGAASGPHLTFGPPHAIVEAWLEDTGDEFRSLAAGAATSVTFNARRIALINMMPTRATTTEH